MRILGLSAFYHDSAATLVEGGWIAAAQEERFTRRKHDSDYPANATPTLWGCSTRPSPTTPAFKVNSGEYKVMGDARSPTMQKTLNLKVKHRESFRPRNQPPLSRAARSLQS